MYKKLSKKKQLEEMFEVSVIVILKILHDKDQRKISTENAKAFAGTTVYKSRAALAVLHSIGFDILSQPRYSSLPECFQKF